MPSKISKATACYQFEPETEYVCGDCAFLKPLGKQTAEEAESAARAGCAFFDPADIVSPKTGACNYFTHIGEQRPEIPWLGLFTPTQLGYAENAKGFSCSRCSHFSMQKSDCEVVDKDSPGDTPGEVDARGCCNAWDPDPKRSKMTTPDLMEMLALIQADPGKLHPDDYRKLRDSEKAR